MNRRDTNIQWIPEVDCKCGHPKEYHEMSVLDPNKLMGECTHEIGDEGEQYYCQCLNFEPRVNLSLSHNAVKSN